MSAQSASDRNALGRIDRDLDKSVLIENDISVIRIHIVTDTECFNLRYIDGQIAVAFKHQVRCGCEPDSAFDELVLTAQGKGYVAVLVDINGGCALFARETAVLEHDAALVTGLDLDTDLRLIARNTRDDEVSVRDFA